MPKRTLKQWLRVVHKWAGLLAAAWLITLGATGIVLDHPEWRLPNQLTVPESWGSPELTRFIRITVMRQALTDPQDKDRWLGGSERGLHTSDDGGDHWQGVAFDGLDYSPQVLGVQLHPVNGFDGAIVATDDGLWQYDGAVQVSRLALAGKRINSLSPVPESRAMLGVAERSNVFEFDTMSNLVVWHSREAIDPVIAEGVTLNRYILNTHFGHGLLEGWPGVLINDFGGFAMLVLGTTGCLYWFLRRRFRKPGNQTDPARKRRVTAWLYRSHAPVIGILAVIPILYLSITGILGNHIRAIYDWTASVTVPAPLVPAGFSMRSLDGDIQDIVVNPQDPDEWLIATRKGLYTSTDRGLQWLRSDVMPIERADYGNSLHLFRLDETLILSAGLGANFFSDTGGKSWEPIEGPFTGISSGALGEGELFLKNSQGFFGGELGAPLNTLEIKPPVMQGMPLFLFLADIHTGHAIHPAWPWVSDVLTFMAILLALSGPIIWWRRRWM